MSAYQRFLHSAVARYMKRKRKQKSKFIHDVTIEMTGDFGHEASEFSSLKSYLKSELFDGPKLPFDPA